MPRPAYLICSQSGSVDRFTNHVSCHNLVESIDITPTTAEVREHKESESAALSVRIIAAWLREPDDDPDQIFEASIALLHESASESMPIGGSPIMPFTFSKAIHRLTVPKFVITGVPGPGLLILEARVRRAGQKDWMSTQSYPILLREASLPEATIPAPPPGINGQTPSVAPLV